MEENNEFFGPGSYRINWPFRQYFLVLEDKKTVACGADLAKIYSGHLNGVRYHRYEKQDCSFVSNLGCELPPLIQRSLFLLVGKCLQRIIKVKRYSPTFLRRWQ